ncbi:MAG: NACHT domain-containing protein, partial [Cyanobacteria bacterium P01_A01_bin.80]
MSDNKPEQQSTLTKSEPGKVEKVEEKAEVKPKESRKEARRKRVQRILQVFGFPSSGFGIFATIHFLRSGEVEKAAIAFLLTVGVTLIAIAGKFGKNVISKILDRIEEKLEKQEDNLATVIVDGLEGSVIRLFSGFRGKYYQSLIYICRDYRTQGLKTKGPFTLDLEKVFVPLRVAAESAGNISPALIQSRDSDIEGLNEGLSIWDFLAASRNNHKYNCNYRTIVIIGAPGTGKTTLLENLTLTYAKNNQRRKHKQAPKLIPILLYLRDIRETITESPQLSLSELLEQQIEKNKSSMELKPPKNWFKDKLRSNSGSNRCLVMLDGLDEVADETQRRAVSTWVKQQIQSYPHARFILTSRPFGYRSAPVEGIDTVLEVQPFNLEQMQKFIYNWYLQSEIMSRLGKEDAGVRNTAKQKAEDLIKRIKNSSPLAAMALNPLLLTMIATVHCYRGALPEGRVELYGEICDVLLGRRREAKGIGDNIRPNQKKAILQVLALGLMEQKTREFTPQLGCSLIQGELAKIAASNLKADKFLKKIENESGLLVEREKNKYEFAHKSFQEYLAALQIKESNQEDILTTHINDDWWEETIRLYANGSDATNIIRAALVNPSIISLRIAFDCSEEGRCEPEVREQLLEKLDSGLESDDKEIFQLAAEVKLSRRLKRLLRVDENLQIDQSYITWAEYQLYVDEKLNLSSLNSGNLSSKNLNSPKRFQPGSAKQPITDITWEDALSFCAWLSAKAVLQQVNNIDTQEIYYYRLPTTNEIENHQAREYKKLQSWTVAGNALTKQGIRVVRNRISSDYINLVNYLAKGEWEKADKETE